MMKPDDLLTPAGAYDKATILRDAYRQRRQMMRHGLGVEPLPQVLMDKGVGDARAAESRRNLIEGFKPPLIPNL